MEKIFEPSCEFCLEFSSFSQSRVGKIYKEVLKSRKIKESENFIVVPTIGQTLTGHLLVLPKHHVESCAEVQSEAYCELNNLLHVIEEEIGKCILFEHGAKKASGSSCGVYHAHVHIVPTSMEIDSNNLIGSESIKAKSIEECLKQLHNSQNYILFRNQQHEFYFAEKTVQNAHRFTSQYFRRWIIEQFSLNKEWDWRKYDYVEQELITSMQISYECC